MANIKTRESNKGTIRTLDRASVLAGNIKQANIRTKSNAQSESHDEHAPEGYAQNQMTRYSNEVARKAFAVNGDTVVKAGKTVRRKQRTLGKRPSSYSQNSARNVRVRNQGRLLAVETYERHQMQKKAIDTTKKNTVRALKLTAKAAAAVIESAKSLAVAIATGGWVALVIVIVFVFFKTSNRASFVLLL